MSCSRFITYLVAGVVIAATSAEAAAASRITRTSAVRVREAPEPGAREVVRIDVSAVLEELERGEERMTIGGREDHWYRVRTARGQEGWVFGGYTLPCEKEREIDAIRAIADEREANPGTLPEQEALLRALSRRVNETRARASKAELELIRLKVLMRTFAWTSQDDNGELEDVQHWLRRHRKELASRTSR